MMALLFLRRDNIISVCLMSFFLEWGLSFERLLNIIFKSIFFTLLCAALLEWTHGAGSDLMGYLV